MSLFWTIFGAIVCARLFRSGVTALVEFAVAVISESQKRGWD